MSDCPQPDGSKAAEDAGTRCPLCNGALPAGTMLNPAWFRRWLGDSLARQLGLYPLPEGFLLSVVIPVYNEEATLRELVRRVRAVPLPLEIILVDDGSTDGTGKVLAELEGADGLAICRHAKNRGKGAALRTGFARARGTVIVTQDADLEYDASQFPCLIQPVVEGVADVVYGSRFLAGGPHRVLYYWHYVANRILTTLSNMFSDLNLTDMETGHKVFRREVIHAILPTLKEDGFGIEPELTAKVARRGYRVYEMGISYHGRTYEAGKKIGLGDALRAVWCILRYWKWD